MPWIETFAYEDADTKLKALYDTATNLFSIGYFLSCFDA